MRFPPAALVLSLAALTLVGPSTPARASLIGYWSFDGCTTNATSGIAGDLAGGGGVTCVTGSSGQAWQFDGSTGYLMGGNSNLEPGTRAWSVVAWVNVSTDVGYEYVVSWYRCGANPNCQNADAALYQLLVHDNHPYWDVRDDTGAEHILEPTAFSILDGKWHQLVGTMNPATGNYSLYVDGALAMTDHLPFAPLSSGGVGIPLSIGRIFRQGWASPGYYFDGSIDEVRIYDEELSAGAVAALYSNSAAVHGGPFVPAEMSIAGAAPNPARGGRVTIAFALPSADPARLTLYDLAGRVVALQPVGILGPGRHEVTLAPGRRLSPGVYVVQLLQNGRALTRRVDILD